MLLVAASPAAPAGVLLAAAGPVPHSDGIRVTGVKAAPSSGFDLVKGIVDRGEELCPPVAVESVSVGDEP